MSRGRIFRNVWFQAFVVLGLCAALYWPLLGTPGFGSSEGHRVVPAWHMLESQRWFHIEMFGATYLRKPPGFPWAIAVSSMIFGQTEFAARAVSAASCSLMALLALWAGRRWFGSPLPRASLRSSDSSANEVSGHSVEASAHVAGRSTSAPSDEAGICSTDAAAPQEPLGRASPRTSIQDDAPWLHAAGLGAGIAQATMPQFVSIGRLAEIDALNALGTQMACIGLIELAARRPNDGAGSDGDRGIVAPFMFMLLASVGILIAGLAKGPASVTCLLGVLIAPVILTRRLRGKWWTLGSLLLAAAVLVPLSLRILNANPAKGAVTQDFSEFTWSLSRLSQTAVLIPSAFAAAIPASVALIVLLAERLADRDAKRRGISLQEASPQRLLAHVIALAWLMSVGTLMLAGISNPRYAMPAAVLLPPLVAYLIRTFYTKDAVPNESPGAAVRTVAKWSLLGHPIVIPLIVIPLLVWWSVIRETYRPRREEGRLAGTALAEVLPDGAVVWANDLIEARPDVLLYAQQYAAKSGKAIVPRWMPAAMLNGTLPDESSYPSGTRVFLLLRRDGAGREVSMYAPRIDARDPIRDDGQPRLVERASGRVASYEFGVYELLTP
jgi:4-amino-4-deoxy-L-arabinose transferase-like glycosyltransferase